MSGPISQANRVTIRTFEDWYRATTPWSGLPIPSRKSSFRTGTSAIESSMPVHETVKLRDKLLTAKLAGLKLPFTRRPSLNSTDTVGYRYSIELPNNRQLDIDICAWAVMVTPLIKNREPGRVVTLDRNRWLEELAAFLPREAL